MKQHLLLPFNHAGRLAILILIWHLAWPLCAFPFEPVSIKKFPQKAIPVTNPVDLTVLPLRETFQINHPRYVLQFFFSGPNILGIILKRDLRFPIHLRWCFFRDCTESPFDYNVMIADSYAPPLEDGVFEIRFPPQLKYNFQGLHFSTGR